MFAPPAEAKTPDTNAEDDPKYGRTMEGMLSNAIRTLDKALAPSWSGVSKPVVKHCKGVVLYSVTDWGLALSGHNGSGVVIAHNEDGTWSGPVALAIEGGGIGATIGYQNKDAMIFCMGRPSMKSFESEQQSGNIGVNLDLAAGPVGRAAELDLNMGDQAIGATYCYNFSKGLFVGAGVKATGFIVQAQENEKFYGKAATPKEILEGGVTIPEGSKVAELHEKLNMLAEGKTKEQEQK